MEEIKIIHYYDGCFVKIESSKCGIRADQREPAASIITSEQRKIYSCKETVSVVLVGCCWVFFYHNCDVKCKSK